MKAFEFSVAGIDYVAKWSETMHDGRKGLMCDVVNSVSSELFSASSFCSSRDTFSPKMGAKLSFERVITKHFDRTERTEIWKQFNDTYKPRKAKKNRKPTWFVMLEKHTDNAKVTVRFRALAYDARQAIAAATNKYPDMDVVDVSLDSRRK